MRRRRRLVTKINDAANERTIDRRATRLSRRYRDTSPILAGGRPLILGLFFWARHDAELVSDRGLGLWLGSDVHHEEIYRTRLTRLPSFRRRDNDGPRTKTRVARVGRHVDKSHE